MVQLRRSVSSFQPDPSAASVGGNFPVKLQIEDLLESEQAPLHKRAKCSTPLNEWSTGNNEFPVPPSHYNPLDEPSPLGLRLKKSPSLLDLVQMMLSKGNTSSIASAPSEKSRDKKDAKGSNASSTAEKLKATNFPAMLLRIGNWEFLSRFEGDLIAKCYFAKHKLVWEILEGGLKSKIEIQWSDIMALKANCPADGPETLAVTLARPPHFCKEINPQPRKHTLWDACEDFTDGQASIHRQHFLQCEQGLLNKHYEKLIQCDMHLNLVSQRPEMGLDSPYFLVQGSVPKDSNESIIQKVDELETTKGSSLSGFHHVPSISLSCSSKFEQQDSVGVMLDYLSREAPLPSSVMDLHGIDGNKSRGGARSLAQQDQEQLKNSGLHPSMSMSDLVNRIGNCISERMGSVNSTCFKDGLEYQGILENVAQSLLSDTQLTTASDDNKLMARVNSLCCLLQQQDTATSPGVQAESKSQLIEWNKASESIHESEAGNEFRVTEEYSKDDAPGCNQQVPAMSRKDSFGDLLLNLPRIASLPKFLFDISEDDDDENQTR
ncbi:uncharacterized protein LOC127806590 [Diospyros lotus]|uniref:uncharacterized protein LOC127806590 n=1 Tax=Diospyros lotus TaxID=55363 RepID=UPI00224E7A39|nr:uncharacterized protein LOC127806590 [Diospyros lotus]